MRQMCGVSKIFYVSVFVKFDVCVELSKFPRFLNSSLHLYFLYIKEKYN